MRNCSAFRSSSSVKCVTSLAVETIRSPLSQPPRWRPGHRAKSRSWYQSKSSKAFSPFRNQLRVRDFEYLVAKNLPHPSPEIRQLRRPVHRLRHQPRNHTLPLGHLHSLAFAQKAFNFREVIPQVTYTDALYVIYLASHGKTGRIPVVPHSWSAGKSR